MSTANSGARRSSSRRPQGYEPDYRRRRTTSDTDSDVSSPTEYSHHSRSTGSAGSSKGSSSSSRRERRNRARAVVPYRSPERGYELARTDSYREHDDLPPPYSRYEDGAESYYGDGSSDRVYRRGRRERRKEEELGLLALVGCFFVAALLFMRRGR